MTTKIAVVYIHGKGGSAAEAEHYKPLFPECDVIGFDYKAQTPWDAKAEFPPFFDALSNTYDEIILIANSLGAFLAMQSLANVAFKQAFFISPVVDMEALIKQMMAWAGVTEDELRERGLIPTEFGETLSWNYLAYVRAHPIVWTAPTEILYGEQDNLTPRPIMLAFANQVGAHLTIMPSAEHWFHTPEQMAFLDEWIAHQL